MRFSDARLHAELSRCMYSEHGLDALMRPDAGHVCHSLIVVSYCMPGSAHSHAACAISRISSRARTVSTVSPVMTALSFQSWSCSNARMNSSVTRTELFAFWYWIEYESRPSRSMSNPASRKRARLVLLDRLAPDEVADVRVVDVQDHHLRGATGLAARLDGAGRRVGAAHERDGAGRRAAAGERLLGRTDLRQVDARPGSALEDRAFLDVPVEDRGHVVLDREDETGAALLRRVRARRR